jgi:hypothetical protein
MVHFEKNFLTVLGGAAVYIFTRGAASTDSKQWEALLNTTAIDPNQVKNS